MNQDFDILNSIFVSNFYIIYCSSGERDIVIRELETMLCTYCSFHVQNRMNLMKYNQYQYVNQ